MSKNKVFCCLILTLVLVLTLLFAWPSIVLCENTKNEEDIEARNRMSVLIVQLQNEDPYIANAAARELTKFGIKAGPAIPALIEILISEGDHWESDASKALGTIGTPAIPALVKTMKSENQYLRTRCLSAFLKMGDVAAPAFKEIAKCLDDTWKPNRQTAALTIAKLGAGAEQAVPQLIKMLKEDRFEVYNFNMPRDKVEYWIRTNPAVYALASIGPGALPALKEAARTGEKVIKGRCAQVFGWMGNDAQSAIETLINLTKDKEADIREQVAYALMEVAPHDKEAIEAVVCLLGDRYHGTAYGAAHALSKAGPDAVPILTKTMNDEKISKAKKSMSAIALKEIHIRFPKEDQTILKAFVDVLKSSHHDTPWLKAVDGLALFGPRCVSAVTELVGSTDSSVRKYAGFVFDRLGPEGSSGVPELIKWLNSKDPGISTTAAKCLSFIGRQAIGAVPSLIRILKENGNESRLWYALKALEVIGPEASDAIPVLKDQLNAASERIRRQAIYALGSIDRNTEEVIPLLVKALNDKSPKVAVAAAEMIGRLDKKGSKAVVHLARILKNHKDASVRTAVCQALRYIASDNKEAIKALARAAGDDNRTVGDEAAKALIALGDKASIAIPIVAQQLDDLASIGRLARVLENLDKTRLEPLIKPLIKAVLIEVDRPPMGSVDIRMTSAGKVLSKIGAPAIPEVIKLLKHKNELVQYRALEILAAMPNGEATEAVPVVMSFITPEKDYWVVKTAIEVLANVGPKAEKAIPILGKALARIDIVRPWGNKEYENREVAITAHEALAFITGNVPTYGQKLLNLLQDNLQKKQKMLESETKDICYSVQLGDERRKITYQLGQMGVPIIPLLIQQLNSKEWDIRYVAYSALKHMNKKALTAKPEILKALTREPDCSMAMQIIQTWGEKGAEAVPLLMKLCDDTKYAESAAKTLAAIGPMASPATELLNRLLKESDKWETRENALSALTSIGPESIIALPEVLSIIQDETLAHTSIYWKALKVIEGMGPTALSAMPMLMKRFKSHRKQSPSLLEAIVSMGDKVSQVEEDIILIVQQKDSFYASGKSYRELACEALGNIGPSAEKAIPDIRIAEHDPNPKVRLAARRAIKKVSYK